MEDCEERVKYEIGRRGKRVTTHTHTHTHTVEALTDIDGCHNKVKECLEIFEFPFPIISNDSEQCIQRVLTYWVREGLNTLIMESILVRPVHNCYIYIN